MALGQADRQDDAAELLLAMHALGGATYRASAEELQAIDEALEQTNKGIFATDADIRAAFALLTNP